ncbi:MAG: TonB-dependent receptor [Methylibium sp.]|nr:TonB-dependent receptor [Methylibium sp.]
MGRRGINAARHSASLWADWRFPQGALAGWGVGGGARYTGPVYGSPGEAPDSRVPGYTLIDVVLSYDVPSWRLALNLRNLTDKRTVATCSAAGTCFYGAARSVLATATYRW